MRSASRRHGAMSHVVIRGRILRPDGNGFVLMTDAGEQSFYRAQIGFDGKIEFNPAAKDLVEPLIGDLARCNKLPVGTYTCVAAHQGREIVIPQVPIGAAVIPQAPIGVQS